MNHATQYAVITNGILNSAVWYGAYNDLDLAKKVAERVRGKVVIFE